MMAAEEVLRQEPVYEGRIVNLYIETVRLPDGREAKREIVLHGGAVAIVPVDATGHVTLVRQFRLAARQDLLEIPAGTLEPGEDPLECAMRELQEEVSLKPGKLERLGGLYAAPGYTSEYIHLFLATELTESSLEEDEDEFLEVVRLPLGEAVAMVTRGEIIDGKTISGLLLAERFLAGQGGTAQGERRT